jgi:predicted Zn-dependent peptidase
VGGTLKSIGGITLDDVKAMHAGVYQPADAMVFAAGSMSPEVFKAELDKTLGQWKGQGSVPGKPSYSAPTPKPLRVFLIEKPGAVQTAIRFVMPAPTEKDPNRIKLDAIGTVLGGTFTSRLNQNLREDKGYTYGAGSSYVLEPSVGSFVAAANVRTDVTGASLKEFLKEFEAIRGGNISDAEVSKVRASMRTDLVQGASTLNGVVGMAIAQYELGRPYTDLGKDLQEMASLTPAQLNVLVKAGIPLESGVLVLVGDKDKILEQLKGLNLPAPVVVEAE